MQQTNLIDLVTSSNNESADAAEVLQHTIIKYTPESLTDHLLKHQFNGDLTKCESFLSECTTICKNKHDISKEGEINQDLGDVVHTATEGISFISPRGKFQIVVHSKGILLQNNKNEKVLVTQKDVDTMISFPKPEDLMLKKKTPAYYKMITLSSSNVRFKNKEIGFICFPKLSSDDVLEKLSNSLGITKENYVDINQSSYQSENATYPNMPFIQCYSGVNLGSLFPHPKGLLFFKPPLFIPRQYLNSIQCGRGTGNTRYTDLIIDVEPHTNAKQYGEIQFTNIPREELAPLKLYIANLVATDTNDDEDVTNTEEEDEVQVVGEINAKRRRNASISACKRTKTAIASGRYKEDEDDTSDGEDEDFKMGNGSDDDDDDDDSSSDGSEIGNNDDSSSDGSEIIFEDENFDDEPDRNDDSATESEGDD